MKLKVLKSLLLTVCCFCFILGSDTAWREGGPYSCVDLFTSHSHLSCHKNYGASELFGLASYVDSWGTLDVGSFTGQRLFLGLLAGPLAQPPVNTLQMFLNPVQSS